MFRERFFSIAAAAFLLAVMLAGCVPGQAFSGGEEGGGCATTGRRTLVVNASGGGDYTRIQWAVDNASDGDAILVRSGVYREKLHIDTRIELIGDGRDDTFIEGNGEGDVIVIECDEVTLKGFTISKSGNDRRDMDAGIRIEPARKCHILDNRCTNNFQGICCDSIENVLTNNICNNNTRYGIGVYNSDNIISGNTCNFNGDYGIRLFLTIGCELTYNNCSYNEVHGIELHHSRRIDLSNNTLNFNMNNGINLDSSGQNEITANNFLSNAWHGISMDNSRENTIRRNSLSENGIEIIGHLVDYWNSHNIEASNLVNGKPVIYLNSQNTRRVPEGAGQVILADCSNVIVDNQYIEKGSNGIVLGFSNNNSISNNTICSNKGHGIVLYCSQDNVFRNNSFNEDGFYVNGRDVDDWDSNDIDTSNTVNAKPVYYLINTNGGKVPPGAGQVILVNCISVSVENQDLSNGSTSIYLYRSNENFIRNNLCNSNSLAGIRIENSNGNYLDNNSFSLNNMHGVEINTVSSDNVVSSNSCNNNGINGIYLDDNSQNSELVNNTCKSNGEIGIYLFDSSSYTLMKNNDISSNGEYGIFAYWFSSENTIVNNTCTTNGLGLFLVNSDENTVVNNTFSHNSGDGVILAGESNYFRGNLINYNQDQGINVSSFGDNMIIENTFISNSKYGVYLDHWTERTSIYHNNFIDNNQGNPQCFDDSYNFNSNTWNSVETGNFWNDCISPDIDNNGIVDIPYEIDGSLFATDLFPLTEPTTELPPLAEFSPLADAGPDIISGSNLSVVFNGTGSFGLLLNYTWSFEYDQDQITLYGQTPSFTFQIPGIYIVNLTIRDFFNGTDADSFTITVKDITPPVAYAGPDIIIGQFETVEFFFHQNSSDNVGVVNWTWAFEYQGRKQTLFHAIQFSSLPSFKFEIPGVYEITMNVSDSAGNWAVDTLNVTVIFPFDTTPPIADAGPDLVINRSDTVDFFNNQNCSDNVGCLRWTWSYEYNGRLITLDYSSYMSTVPPNATFHIPDIYNITMTVFDGEGNSAIDSFIVTVLDIPSIEIDSDNDTFNDTYEIESGSDPFNFTSTPSDRDGDGYPNDEDAYPDDPARWEREPDDEIPPGDGDDTWGDVRSRYVWAGIGLLGVLIALVTIIVHFLRGRKEDIRRDEDVDSLGRIGKDREGR